MVVAVGGLDLDHTIGDLQQRHVERATTEVEDQDGLFLLDLFQAVGQGRRGRLVDDPQDVQTRDLTGLFGRLALAVVEVCGNRDDRVGHRLTEVGLSVALELLQHAGADFLRGVLLAVDVDVPVRAHVALDRPDCAVGVRDGLPLGDLPDEDFAVLGEGDDGRGGPGAFRVGDHRGFAAFEYRHHGVGGSEVDAYCS